MHSRRIEAVREQLRAAVDEYVEALRALLKRQADAMLDAAWEAATPQQAAEPGPEFYTPQEMPALLKCSRSTYYRVVKNGHLSYSRLYPGGPRVHLPEHVEAYRRRLLEQSVPKGHRLATGDR
jgi:excisionase family DNA binding protein